MSVLKIGIVACKHRLTEVNEGLVGAQVGWYTSTSLGIYKNSALIRDPLKSE